LRFLRQAAIRQLPPRLRRRSSSSRSLNHHFFFFKPQFSSPTPIGVSEIYGRTSEKWLEVWFPLCFPPSIWLMKDPVPRSSRSLPLAYFSADELKGTPAVRLMGHDEWFPGPYRSTLNPQSPVNSVVVGSKRHGGHPFCPFQALHCGPFLFPFVPEHPTFGCHRLLLQLLFALTD